MLNKVILEGRLTKDPIYKETDSYKQARFTIAVDRDYAKDGKRETDFVHAVAWGGTASFIQKYFYTGDLIIVVGRLQIDVDKTDNGYKEYTSVVVENAYFGGAKKEKGDEPSKPASDPKLEELDDDDELPF